MSKVLSIKTLIPSGEAVTDASLPQYWWTSECSAEEKPLRRKCFPQLLGVSFPTLRPTKRQIAAKSCDPSTAEMPLSLIPDLSNHLRHICLRQRAGSFHLIKIIVFTIRPKIY